MEREYFYNGVVAYSDDGKKGSMITGGDTLEEALSELFKSSLYYIGLECEVVIRKVERFCRNCGGNGSVRKGKRTFQFVRCPMCKGKDSRRVLLDAIPVELPRDVKVIMK